MLFLLALLACEPADVDPPGPIDGPATDEQPAISPALAEAPPVTIPDGEPIVRDCSGGAERSVSSSRTGGARPKNRGTRSKPRSAPTPVAAAPAPAPAPTPASGPEGAAPGFGKGSGGAPATDAPVGGLQKNKKDGKLSDSDRRKGDEGLRQREQTESTGGRADEGDLKAIGSVGGEDKKPMEPADSSVTERKAEKEKGIADNHDDDADGVAVIAEPEAEPVEVITEDLLEEAEEEDREASNEETLAANRSRWDWGATVYLSNDDSMSLASAQRVLYAAANNLRLKASEIRPHELLNYFSFDTNPVREGQLFSVLGVAEQHGDTLQVAMSVKGANPPRQALDLTMVVDRSCSMRAEDRMSYTKKGMTIMSDSLKEGDRVDLVLFDSFVCTPLENFVVGRDDPRLLTDAINAIHPTSATDLDAGLREAYRIQTGRDAAETHLRNRRVMVITDANLNAGNVNEALVTEVGKQFENHNIRLTGIGVGREFNDKFLDKLTEKGKGAYIYLGSDAVVERVFGPGFDSMTRTIAHNVQFSIELPNSLAMEKFYGEESSTNAEDVQPINYYASTSQVFLQDLHIRDGRAVRSDPVVMRIRYRDAVTGEPGTQEYRTTIGALLDGDSHNLHKAQALIAWSDVLLLQAMGGDACGASLANYSDLASQLSDDAEIAYVNGLVGKTCRVDMTNVVASGVAFKVRVDSDIPIAEVGLDCQGRNTTSRLSASDTVARFGNARPGACTLTLQGQVAMRTEVDVPETGGDVRCMVRGGRMTCS